MKKKNNHHVAPSIRIDQTLIYTLKILAMIVGTEIRDTPESFRRNLRCLVVHSDSLAPAQRIKNGISQSLCEMRHHSSGITGRQIE